MLQVFVNGYLGQDAVLQSKNENSQIVFSIAHTDVYKDATGAKQERTVWMNCVYWSDNVKLKELLVKGSLVSVMGTFNVNSYIDGNNNAKHVIYVTVSKLDILVTQKANNNV